MPAKDIRIGFTIMGLLVPLFLVAVFVYFSTDSSLILQAEPPRQFIDWTPQVKPQEDSAHPCLARAYWQQAVQVVQWKYTFGVPLPNDPPSEFHIDPANFGCSSPADPHTEMKYWQKLRQVWLAPKVWRRTFRWHAAW